MRRLLMSLALGFAAVGAFGAVLVLSGMPAQGQGSIIACVGEHRSGCAHASYWFPCKTTAAGIFQGVCGFQSPRHEIYLLHDRGGNACGYQTYSVVCRYS
jgi:hypothetical protein